MTEDDMVCKGCDFVFDALYSYKIYEQPVEYLCEGCYDGKHSDTEKGIEDDFQT